MTWKEFVEICKSQGVTEETKINYIDIRVPVIKVEHFKDGSASIFNAQNSPEVKN